jgi:hypothetical protein
LLTHRLHEIPRSPLIIGHVEQQSMITASIRLFLLRRLTFAALQFPLWQPIVAITAVGLLVGSLDTGMAEIGAEGGLALGFRLLLGVASTWVNFLLFLAIIHWWLGRRGDWDGQGSLFRLLGAAGLIPAALGALLPLAVAGMVYPLMSPAVWVYSIWVSANALVGAQAAAGMRFALCAVAIAAVSALALTLLLVAVTGLGMAFLAAGHVPAA